MTWNGSAESATASIATSHCSTSVSPAPCPDSQYSRGLHKTTLAYSAISQTIGHIYLTMPASVAIAYCLSWSNAAEVLMQIAASPFCGEGAASTVALSRAMNPWAFLSPSFLK